MNTTIQEIHSNILAREQFNVQLCESTDEVVRWSLYTSAQSTNNLYVVESDEILPPLLIYDRRACVWLMLDMTGLPGYTLGYLDVEIDMITPYIPPVMKDIASLVNEDNMYAVVDADSIVGLL